MEDAARRREEFPHIAAFEENLYHCSSCNYCVEAQWDEWGIEHVCPTLMYHSPAHGYAGKGYIAAARAVFEGRSLDPALLAERAYTCTTCGNCQEVCPIAMHPSHIAVALRSELADRGHAPDFAVRTREAVLARAETVGGSWADGVPDNPHAALALLPGCAAARDLPEEARAAYALLQAGEGVQAIQDAPCCGAPLAALGYPREARACAERLVTRLDASGAERIAVAGAECLAHLTALGGAPAEQKLESVLFAVFERVRDGRLVLTARTDNPPPRRVGYLDSCHLTKKAHGLQGRLYAEQARGLLSGLGITVVESAAAPRFQICCGAAGFMPDSKPEAARRMGEARLDEYEELGAEVVVTASPLCAGHLAACAAASGEGAGGPAVRGLCSFLLAHFQPSAGGTRA